MRSNKTGKTHQARNMMGHAFTRGAFWSGIVSADKWRAMLGNPGKHGKMIKAFFDAMPPDTALETMGEQRFIKQWPKIRNLFSQAERKDQARQRLFDATWSVLVTGDSQYPINVKITSLSKGRQAIIKATVETPGISIYQLAKGVHRDYSRVYKEVMLLQGKKVLDVTKKEKDQGRQISQVFAKDSINTKLAAFGHN